MEKKVYLAGILQMSLSDTDSETANGPPLEAIFKPSIVICDEENPLDSDYCIMLYNTTEVFNAEFLGIIEINPEYVLDILSYINKNYIDKRGLYQLINVWAVSSTWYLRARNDLQSEWMIKGHPPKKYQKFDIHDYNTIQIKRNTKMIWGS